MKFDGEIVEILAAYDLTESLRATAELTGCSHHTVARHVAARDAGKPVADPTYRGRVTDAFLPKIEEWMEKSLGKIRADIAHDKLRGLGYTGAERSTRRAVAQVRVAYRFGRVRVHRPWITEPGMWLQHDFGDGPVIEGKKTVLFIAWLAWSRFRVVIALRDRTAPTVFAALERTFRIIEGAPTYVLPEYVPRNIFGHQMPGSCADEVEHCAQAVADTLGRFAAVGLHEAHVRERERDDEDVQDLPDPGDDGLGLAEIDLRGPGRPDQFGEAFPGLAVLGIPFPDEALHRGVAAGVALLDDEAVKDPFGGVALLARPALVLAQPQLNGVFEPGQDRTSGPGHARRWLWRKILLLGVLDHRVAVDPQPAGDFPGRDSVGIECSDIFLHGHGYRHLLPGSFRRDRLAVDTPFRNLSGVAGPCLQLAEEGRGHR
nr:hypothetical protein [Cryobacterium lactosi]